jgi:hypothetical protein
MRVHMLPADVRPMTDALNAGEELALALIVKVLWARLNDLEAHVAEQDRTIDALSAGHWKRNAK